MFWRLTSEDGSGVSWCWAEAPLFARSLISRIKILRQGYRRESGGIFAWSMSLVYWILCLRMFLDHIYALCFIFMFRVCKAFSLRRKEVWPGFLCLLRRVFSANFCQYLNLLLVIVLCVHPGELGRNRFPVGRVPVLFMRINVAKEDGYLCRILAVEVRRVKCVFPRNKVQKEIHLIPKHVNME